MKTKVLIFIIFITCNISGLFAQFVDWKHQVVRYVSIGTTPSNPDNYNWHEESTKGQGVHINLTPTEIVNIYMEKGNNRISFGFYISPTSYSHYLTSIDVRVNYAGWMNLYQGNPKTNHVWSNSADYFSFLGSHNLQVRYMVAGSSTIYYREYNVKIVPQSDKLFFDQYGNTMRLWKGNSTSPYPLLLSPGFDAYNTKPEQYYRYAGSELFDCLLENGFDIYVLYYKYNPQDLRNNAAIYSSAIDYISNTWNNSNNIVAAGISMGGVISRYALAKAEHIGDPLPVDKWISLEAPHQGAYISKELQDFLEEKTSDDFDKYANNNAAAKILMIYNVYDKNPDGFNIYNGTNRGIIHTNFYNELNNLNGNGYPQLTHNIGVTFSTNVPSPHSYNDTWLNISPPNRDFELKPLELEAGSYLPQLNIDPSMVMIWWGLYWTTITVTQYKHPVFISHASSLDIVNGVSRFDKTIIPSVTDFHDVVPSELIPEILTELIKNDLYLQNQTITGNEHFKAGKTIIAGRNVTSDEPQGDIIIEPGANVVFQAGEKIVMKPGFHAKAGSNFRAYIDPYFTCTQFSNKMLLTDGNENIGSSSLVKEYSTTYEPATIEDVAISQKNQSPLNIYPNPFTSTTTIKYNLERSSSVTVTIYDNSGIKLLLLENKRTHEAGTYEVTLKGINLPAGVYYCTLQTESFTETIKLIKME
jgi:hypothetical protein